MQLGGITLLVLQVLVGAGATSIAEIQGSSFQSPLVGETVHDVAGVVTVKDRYGFWLEDEPSDDPRVSSGLRVYGPNIVHQVQTGDLVSLSGHVSEYRHESRPNDLFLTELDFPSNLRVLSSNHNVTPLILGEDVQSTPPSVRYSSLDEGSEGWLSIPNNASLIENVNASLQPDKFGLDFWESLEGRLVTLPTPTACNFPDMFGSIWVYGGWETSGKNARGGLTLTFVGEDETPDAQARAILIGNPLDGTRNPKTSVGMSLSDITGVITYQFGYYYILPLTAPVVVSAPETDASPASLYSSEEACEITIGDYNVENMSPRSHHITRIADHIVNYLHSPDIMFLQEIQDDSGSRNNGVVSANRTLRTLVNAISRAEASRLGSSDSKYEYSFVDVPPEDNMDGGKPGGNIRVAYLWRPHKVSLIPGSVRGNATQATDVIEDKEGSLTLSFNPGRINPNSVAWEDTRKPLAAAWQTTTGERFFTVNVHLSSKRDGSSPHGDARPPVNGHSDRRTHQVNVTADFIESILAKDVNASIILAGDMNDFIQTRSVFRSVTSLLADINESSGVDAVERYTYVYEQHSQEIDHIFVSDSVKRRGTKVEHVHVNTWAKTIGERVSDHDPTVAKVWVCGGPNEVTGARAERLVVQDRQSWDRLL